MRSLLAPPHAGNIRGAVAYCLPALMITVHQLEDIVCGAEGGSVQRNITVNSNKMTRGVIVAR